MYKELAAELRDYDGPVIYEDADGQHVERTAVDLTRRAADAIERLQAEQQEMMDLLSDITQKYDTCVKIQRQMTEVSNALQAELERAKHELDERRNLAPCDVCRYGPASSRDGNPCTMCPAVRRRIQND